MEIHKIKLKQRCRYGNCMLDDNSNYAKKEQFFDEFNHLKVNLNDDIMNIHPELVCNKHKALLYRCRNSIKAGDNFVPTAYPVTFLPHNDNCVVCYDEVMEHHFPIKKRKVLVIVIYFKGTNFRGY